MIGLYLLAAHLLGDFVLQTRWQAASKLVDRGMRRQHVWGYAVPFVPLVCWRCWGEVTSWHTQRGVVFIVLLVLLHYLTDSRRFLSTLGDWTGWHTMDASERHREWAAALPQDRINIRSENVLPPNPWTPIAIMIDQALHVAQLAVLGGIFLS